MTEAPVTVSPAILAWAARITQLSSALPDLTSADVAARRAAERRLSDAVAREFCAPRATGVGIRNDIVRTRAGSLTIRRYLPDGLATPAPTEVFLHGGGFISGSIHEIINDRLLTARARSARIQVISVDYRLAPEHRYPAAVDDAIAVIDLLCEQPRRFGVDAGRIGIAGASAGAAIAASAALRLRDRGDITLIHQSLEVPAVALTAFGPSAVQFAHGFGMDGYQELPALYLDDNGSNAYAQPLLADDLSGLPPTFVQVAELDPLRDAGLAYGERLRDAGVPTVVCVGAGHVHGSPGLTATFAPARTWQRRSAAAARLAYRHRAHPAA